MKAFEAFLSEMLPAAVKSIISSSAISDNCVHQDQRTNYSEMLSCRCNYSSLPHPFLVPTASRAGPAAELQPLAGGHMALFSAEARALFWGLSRGDGGSFHKASVCNYTKKYGRSVKRIACFGG